LLVLYGYNPPVEQRPTKPCVDDTLMTAAREQLRPVLLALVPAACFSSGKSAWKQMPVNH